MTFEEALRLRAGSLGIKRRCGRVGAHQQGRTVALEARATATWNACSLGVVGGLKARQDRGCSTTRKPRSVVLGLLCVAVFYVAARSPEATHSASSIAATVSSTAEPSIAAAMIRLSDSGAVSSTWRNSSFMPG